MTARTIAIGDIHGCVAALNAVLEQIQPQKDDTIITLGDYIDRGPDSHDVVERLLDLRDRCELISLMGNHELMLLMARENEQEVEFWRECGGQETLLSYGGDLDSISRTHVDFFEGCALAYETDTHIFVHANYDPSLSVEEQDDYVLLWKHLSLGLPEPHVSGKIAIVGHTPQASGEVLDLGHLVCIDTHCFGDGWLTAMDVATKTVWQANKDGEVR